MEKNGKRFLSAMIAATLTLGLMGGYSIKADMKQRTAETYQNETNDGTEVLTSKEREESVTVRVSCTEEGKEHVVDAVKNCQSQNHIYGRNRRSIRKERSLVLFINALYVKLKKR